MPKYAVTQNMGAALKSLRIRQGKKAIDVANSIGKTGAYISKLENATLKTIQEKDLINIIKTLSSDKDEFSNNIELLLSNTLPQYSKEEAEDKEWKLNLELFYQKFSIPDQYLTLVKEKMSALNITSKELTDYINSNSDLYNNESFTKEQLDAADKNHWYFNDGNSFIVINIKEKDLEKVLSNDKNIQVNYSMLLCILVSLFRLEKLPHDEAYKKAYKILSDLQILTISEKISIMRSYDKSNKMHTILDQRGNERLPESDRKLLTSLYDFVKKTNSFAQIHSIDYVNKKMDTMISNLDKDPILFMGYIGVDLERMKDCDISIKREFINAIKDLIDEYSIRKPKSDEELI